uniref:Uncharacterized protein n=1 Tax=Arundo donax TaxID=35708 RepID=A0A0A9DHE4_ARUDO
MKLMHLVLAKICLGLEKSMLRRMILSTRMENLENLVIVIGWMMGMKKLNVPTGTIRYQITRKQPPLTFLLSLLTLFQRMWVFLLLVTTEHNPERKMMLLHLSHLSTHGQQTA